MAEDEAVTVSTDVAVLLTEGVAELGEKLVVTPEGAPVTMSATAELKFCEVTVTVEVVDEPFAVLRPEGPAETEKSLTTKVTVVLLVVEPLVPVTVSVYVPTAAEDDTVTVRVEVTVPLTGGVTVPDERPVVTPEGAPDTVSVTDELKFIDETVMVEVLAEPLVILRLEGPADNS